MQVTDADVRIFLWVLAAIIAVSLVIADAKTEEQAIKKSMMKFWAFNCTRQALLASELELADTGWARMKGLLGRKAAEFRNGKGLWMIPCEGIHTIGMLFPSMWFIWTPITESFGFITVWRLSGSLPSNANRPA